jgi:Putative zinc-finger
MKCTQAKWLFSPYLDGAVTGKQMRAIHDHLEDCGACRKEYTALVHMQRLLQGVQRPIVPADLGLKMRLAISREAAEARRPRFQGLKIRMENTLNAFMVPATAGALSAVVIFGFVMAIVAVPSQLQASNESDVPLMVNTAPELQQTAFGMTLNSIHSDSLVIEAEVDANGRVQDYRILSDPQESQQVLPEVKRMLIFTTFRPAMSMGKPTSGRAVLSFAKISVRG